MVDLSIDESNIILELHGLDKLWAMKSRIEIPFKNVQGAKIDPSAAEKPEGWRMFGTHVPGIITAGLLRHNGKRIFWDVHDPSKTIIINLRDDQYDQLVVEVSNPEQAIDAINGALKRC